MFNTLIGLWNGVVKGIVLWSVMDPQTMGT